MDAKALTERIEQVSRELGLDEPARARLVSEARAFVVSASETAPSDLAKEIARLRFEAEEVRAERDRMAALQGEIMSLLGSPNRDRIVHDLRNLLNDLVLLQAVGRPN